MVGGPTEDVRSSSEVGLLNVLKWARVRRQTLSDFFKEHNHAAKTSNMPNSHSHQSSADTAGNVSSFSPAAAENDSVPGIQEQSHTYEDLKRTQAMLVQQEKLASIGELAAGVAHEINNPISYVQSNLNALERYVKAITELIEMMFRLKGIEDFEERRELWRQIENFRTTADMDFILQEIPNLTIESLHGVERVRQIVSDLRSFSRADGTSMTETDIRDCIGSALNITWNEVKYHATVVKEFEDVPLISCYPQQLTQVFVNLLVNATQAMSGMGEIRIHTWTEGEQVMVTVKDTGLGIAPEYIHRIFDPFFTTKEVGKGTGLGLSIVYGIIQRHRGTISVHSALKQGTEFRIELPAAANASLTEAPDNE
jgi:two-component system NtrC family sensor kinase